MQTGSYTEHNLNVFIQGLQLGSARTRQLPELPPFVDVAPWDGKDAPVEEDVDDLEVEISCVCLESVCDDSCSLMERNEVWRLKWNRVKVFSSTHSLIG